MLQRLRARPELLPGLCLHYHDHPGEFTAQWCDTYDPRNAALGLPTRIPFVLFRRQVEFLQFIFACLRGEADGLVEKCRDMGATWGAIGATVEMYLFWDGISVGWGSRKEQLVDRIADPDSIFEKMRMMIRGLPQELRPAGLLPEHLSFMRLVNPETGATVTGEAGDNIGRGGRKSIYFKDESAWYEHPESIEAALTDNTRVQMDISSVHGLGTVFHRKRSAGVEWEPGCEVARGRTNVFVMDWRDHPAKTVEWYEARKAKARDEGLLHVFAQEVDRNYAASVEGVLIPPEWAHAAVDAHVKLGLDDSGAWSAALDVADGGLDTNTLLRRKGIVLKSAAEWGDRDTGVTTRRAVNGCKGVGPLDLQYDCVGIGAGVKAEANRLRDEGLMPAGVRLIPWNAGAEVVDKDKHLIPGDANSPLNGDFFGNFKAQAWWSVARRLEHTWRAVTEPGFKWDRAKIISIDGSIPLLGKLLRELSQVTADTDNARMKLIINKTPEGTKSPNLGDGFVMTYFPVRAAGPLVITAELLAWSEGRR